jgi:hypothetical protein
MILELLVLDPIEVLAFTFGCSKAFFLKTYCRSSFVFLISYQTTLSRSSYFFSLWFIALIDLAFSFAALISFDSLKIADSLFIKGEGDGLLSGVVSLLFARSFTIFCLSFAVVSFTCSFYTGSCF